MVNGTLKLSLHGIRCGACDIPDLVSTDKAAIEMFAREHIGHGKLLFLATVTDPPEMKGTPANFEPHFKKEIPS